MVRKLIYGIVLAFVLFLVVSILSVMAAITPVLRPIADGKNDNPLWSADNFMSCDKLSCYLRVRESSGSVCSAGSDGDTSYIESRTAGARQTLFISTAGIPDKAKISKITVTACAKKTKPADPPNAFRTLFCMKGACVDGGADIIPTAGYVATTQTFLTNFSKTAESLEIGAVITGTTSTLTRISNLSAFITYTPATSSPPAATTSIAAFINARPGAAAVTPTFALFTGQAYPGGTVDLSRKSPAEDLYGVVPDERYDINNAGAFRILDKGLLQSEYLFTLEGVDPDGRRSGPVQIAENFISANRLIKEDILFPPTVEVSDTRVRGYSAPKAHVKMYLDGAATELISDPSGYYVFSLPPLAGGTHQVSVQQTYRNQTSGLSPVWVFSTLTDSPVAIAPATTTAPPPLPVPPPAAAIPTPPPAPIVLRPPNQNVNLTATLPSPDVAAPVAPIAATTSAPGTGKPVWTGLGFLLGLGILAFALK